MYFTTHDKIVNKTLFNTNLVEKSYFSIIKK